MGLFDFLGLNKNQGPQSKEAYFLNEDDAKSFGDIDFMRKEVVVRRTFAKKKGQEEELESVKSISSSTSKEVGEVVKPAAASFTPTFSAPTPPAPTPAPVAETAPAPVAETAPAPVAETAPAPAEPAVRRAPDTSMDMFRNMAKNIRR
ncbi:MAG: hypothetical protein KTR27_05440 [Leptolyngbyaceae cyanobacterium MAG.088]|nr:hypothetical protein [Leptolyngbyaceae cyanobacterium MAG.088]